MEDIGVAHDGDRGEAPGKLITVIFTLSPLRSLINLFTHPLPLF
jgi:hypothetical protein